MFGILPVWSCWLEIWSCAFSHFKPSLKSWNVKKIKQENQPCFKTATLELKMNSHIISRDIFVLSHCQNPKV